MQAVINTGKRVGLATYEGAPDLATDDQALVPALQRLGVDAVPVVWTNEAVDWGSFDSVVVRSCWDYHLRVAEFHRWLQRLESIGVIVCNSPALIRWNSNKRYLIDLAERGAATIPTRIAPVCARASDIANILSAEGWNRAVIKPAISASGFETYAVRCPLSSQDARDIERATAVGETLVQPFAVEVPRDGEYSFVFIDGTFSHAAIKRAAPSEFRVQTEHGGRVDPIEAPRALVAQAQTVLALLPEVPLYARVDGIERHGAFVLMELEMIEPNLFLELKDGAANELGSAIVRRIVREV